MPTLAIFAEADPLTEHLVLLIIAVASAGVLLLIILLWSSPALEDSGCENQAAMLFDWCCAS